MKITDMIDVRMIDLQFKAKTKEESINILVDMMDLTGNIKDKEQFKCTILEREGLCSTGVGHGVAIPHGKSKSVSKATIVSAVSKDGIDFDSLDGQPVHLLFMIAVPDNSDNIHLDILSHLSTIVSDEKFRSDLINCSSNYEFLKLIDDKEKEKFPDEYNSEEDSVDKAIASQKEIKDNNYKILAVTACPTGISHTYMAAESLKNKADEMGISIKIETNGASGPKNVLTSKEIDNAECIIIASDKRISMERFNLKKVIICPVDEGIFHPEKLISDAINGKGKIYKAEDDKLLISNHNSKDKFKSLFQNIYKVIMNGISDILPFAIIYGIALSLIFIIDSRLRSGTLPSIISSEALNPILNAIMLCSYNLMCIIISGSIASTIGKKPAFVVGCISGYICNAGSFQSCIVGNITGRGAFITSIIVGFIAGLSVLMIRTLVRKIPDSIKGLNSIIIEPVLGLIIALLLIIFLRPVTDVIAYVSFNTLNSMSLSSSIIIGTILGAMMALDMGGPINKLSYITGIIAITMGNFTIMASVMAGGMVPPLSIALSSTLFKNRYTAEEKRLCRENYLKGLLFITEGAISFTKSYGKRVIIPCVIGSAIAGGLSSYFCCTLRIPHGGILAVILMEHPIYYICAIFIGALVGSMGIFYGLYLRKSK